MARSPQLGKQGAALGNGLGLLPVGRESGSAPRGEVLFPYAGDTTTWTVPEGVTSICALAISGGGGGLMRSASTDSVSGGGGALAWVSNVAVKAGDIITIDVGLGGYSSIDTDTAGSGSASKITHLDLGVVLHAAGGTGASYTVAGVGGTVVVGDGGSGGAGAVSKSGTGTAVSGGACGGYSGTGGAGKLSNNTLGNLAGNDGAGGGGGSGSVIGAGSNHGNSGTTGIYGEGASGSGGAIGYGGGSGSGTYTNQANERRWINIVPLGTGGGAHALGTTYGQSGASTGGNGIVRILWGAGREFPSTDVGRT